MLVKSSSFDTPSNFFQSSSEQSPLCNHSGAVEIAHRNLKRERGGEVSSPDRKFTKSETSSPIKANFINIMEDRLIQSPKSKEDYKNLLKGYKRVFASLEKFKELSEIVAEIPDEYIDSEMLNLIFKDFIDPTKNYYQERRNILFNILERISGEIDIERSNYFTLLVLCSSIEDPSERIKQLLKIISKFEHFKMDVGIVIKIQNMCDGCVKDDKSTELQVLKLLLNLFEKKPKLFLKKTSQVLMKRFSRLGNEEGALRCYEIIKQTNIKPNRRTFSSLFWALKDTKDVKELVKIISFYKEMWKNQIVPDKNIIKAIRIICELPYNPHVLKNIENPTLYCFGILCQRMLDLSMAEGDNEGIRYAIKEMEWANLPISEDIGNKVNARDAFLSDCAEFKSIKNPDYNSLEKILTQYQEMVKMGVILDETIEKAIKSICGLKKVDKKVEELKNDPSLYCLGILGQKMLELSISQVNSEAVWKLAMELNSVKISLNGSSDFVLNKLKADKHYASYELPLRCELFQLFNEEIESKE